MKPVEESFRRLTPLHLAAAANWPEAVELLLANGTDKHAQDSELCLPIDFAIQTQCMKAVELLLDGDCTFQFSTPRSLTICNLPAAVLHGILWTDGSIRDVLLRALIRQQNSLGTLPLYHVFPLWARDGEHSIYAAERLFSGGFVDLELRDKYGKTALMQACWHGYYQYSRFLLEKELMR
jgi:ankyrin repeat protein